MAGGTDEKRMRLRYAGVCRVCGVELPAKADAIYERTTKTVRCVSHDASPQTGFPVEEATASAIEEVARRADADVVEPAVVEGASSEAADSSVAGVIDSGIPGASARREFELPEEYQLSGAEGQNQIGANPSHVLSVPRSQRTTLK